MSYSFNPFTGNFDTTTPVVDLGQVLPLSGGTLTGRISSTNDVGIGGALTVSGGMSASEAVITDKLDVYGDMTIRGTLSALSGVLLTNTTFAATTAVAITNTGVGPALYVKQEGLYDVASFYNTSDVEVLHVGSSVSGSGKVGINNSFPNEELTVTGNISASGCIYADSGNSANWNSVHTTVQTNSSSWATVSFLHNNFLPLSGGLITDDLTVSGNLSVLGTVTRIDTAVMVTSAVSVTNAGVGPAVLVVQSGAQPIAAFYDGSSIALMIQDGGKVGINTDSPNKTLTIIGDLSATGSLYTTAGDSAQWNSTTDVQIFAISGTFTWTKPANARLVEVQLFGGGGGGASGKKDSATATIRCGGGAGAGGSYVRSVISASALGSTETVIVGVGGSGGVGQTVNTQNGNSGSPGTESSFSNIHCAGGNPGSGGSSTGGSGGQPVINANAGASANTTGAGNIGTPQSSNSSYQYGGSGGGSGGSLVANAVTGTSGGAGGRSNIINMSAGGGGTAGNPGNNGQDNAAAVNGLFAAGSGGGGGGSSLTSNGGTGGAGGFPAGGGGGGGATQTGTSSGAGGRGADGLVVVITYF